MLILLAGCGSSSSSSSSTSSSSASSIPAADTDTQQVLQRWAAAETVAQACDLLSSGFRFFIGDGDPSKTGCTSKFASVVGTLHPGPLEVRSLTEQYGQKLADITVGGTAQTLYLIKQYDTLKINSIGIREGVGPSPPPISVYNG